MTATSDSHYASFYTLNTVTPQPLPLRVPIPLFKTLLDTLIQREVMSVNFIMMRSTTEDASTKHTLHVVSPWRLFGE